MAGKLIEPMGMVAGNKNVSTVIMILLIPISILLAAGILILGLIFPGTFGITAGGVLFALKVSAVISAAIAAIRTSLLAAIAFHHYKSSDNLSTFNRPILAAIFISTLISLASFLPIFAACFFIGPLGILPLASQSFIELSVISIGSALLFIVCPYYYLETQFLKLWNYVCQQVKPDVKKHDTVVENFQQQSDESDLYHAQKPEHTLDSDDDYDDTSKSNHEMENSIPDNNTGYSTITKVRKNPSYFNNMKKIAEAIVLAPITVLLFFFFKWLFREIVKDFSRKFNSQPIHPSSTSNRVEELPSDRTYLPTISGGAHRSTSTLSLDITSTPTNTSHTCFRNKHF